MDARLAWSRRRLPTPAGARVDRATHGNLRSNRSDGWGICPRLAAVALALFVAFVSLFFIKFWSFDGSPDARTAMRNGFVGNVGVIGGLVYVATLGAGRLVLIDV